MRALWLFPGQGGQYCGMLKAVAPKLKLQVKNLLNVSLLDTDAGYLDSVQLQLSIVLMQIAQIKQLFAAGVRPALVAGHSLGAFAAAYAAGCLKQDDLFRIVGRRAKLMQSAYPQGYGMGVVVGLTKKQLKPLVAKVNRPLNPVYLSNQNAATQICISGKLTAINQVLRLAKQAGAAKAQRLKVPVPSHSPLMNKVAMELKKQIDLIELTTPTARYLTNYSGRAVRQAKLVKYDLTNNLKYPVYFAEMMAVAHDYHPDVIVNFSPGTPFKRILKRVFGDIHQIDLNQVSITDAIYLLNKWQMR